MQAVQAAGVCQYYLLVIMLLIELILSFFQDEFFKGFFFCFFIYSHLTSDLRFLVVVHRVRVFSWLHGSLDSLQNVPLPNDAICVDVEPGLIFLPPK
jgi:hypothetical protein